MNEPKIDPLMALNNLYNAARLAPLNAEAHEFIKQSSSSLQKFIINSINPPKIEEPVVLENPKNKI